MSCDDCREALYLRETSPELDEHLAGCEDCRRRRARLEWLDRVIRETPVPEPSPDLVERVLARLAAVDRETKGFWWWVPVE